MFDGVAILAYPRYFLGRLWPRLTRAREAKVAKGDLAAGFIEIISAEDVLVWGIYRGPIPMEGASAEYICVNAGSSSIGFIDMLLNFVGPCGSSIITDLPFILRRL